MDIVRGNGGEEKREVMSASTRRFAASCKKLEVVGNITIDGLIEGGGNMYMIIFAAATTAMVSLRPRHAPPVSASPACEGRVHVRECVTQKGVLQHAGISRASCRCASPLDKGERRSMIEQLNDDPTE